MINGIWGVIPTLLQDFFLEKNRHFICIWFLNLDTKILLANF